MSHKITILEQDIDTGMLYLDPIDGPFEITGRGTAYTAEGVDPDTGVTDLTTLNGRHITINGDPYRITGVEMHCDLNGHLRIDRSLGIVVKPFSNNDYLKEQMIYMAVRDGKSIEHGTDTYNFVNKSTMEFFGAPNESS